MRLNPELPRGADRVDTFSAPPIGFIAGAVQFAMMATAERHGEFVADLDPETSGLRKAQRVGIARLPGTDQAGLPGDKAEVGLVAVAAQLGKGQHALVDSGQFGLRRGFLDLRRRGSLVGGGRRFAASSIEVRWTMAISCRPRLLRTRSNPLASEASRKPRSPSRGKGDWMAAVSDFSGLASSIWALASALAMAPIVSLQCCITGLHGMELKTDGADLERFARTPWPMASLASSGTSFFNSSFAAS